MGNRIIELIEINVLDGAMDNIHQKYSVRFTHIVPKVYQNLAVLSTKTTTKVTSTIFFHSDATHRSRMNPSRSEIICNPILINITTKITLKD